MSKYEFELVNADEDIGHYIMSKAYTCFSIGMELANKLNVPDEHKLSFAIEYAKLIALVAQNS